MVCVSIEIHKTAVGPFNQIANHISGTMQYTFRTSSTKPRAMVNAMALQRGRERAVT